MHSHTQVESLQDDGLASVNLPSYLAGVTAEQVPNKDQTPNSCPTYDVPQIGTLKHLVSALSAAPLMLKPHA